MTLGAPTSILLSIIPETGQGAAEPLRRAQAFAEAVGPDVAGSFCL